MKSDWKKTSLWIDIINMIIGIAIIILAVISLQTGDNGQNFFLPVFLLGMLMFILNALRSYRRNRLQAFVFFAFAVVLAAACVISAGIIKV